MSALPHPNAADYQDWLGVTEQVGFITGEVADHALHILFPPEVVFDPVQWARDHGIFLWSKQEELLQSIADHKFTACRACHEVGKSFAMAVAILAWIDTYGADAFVVFTAPTYPQVDAIIGRELRDMVDSLGLEHIEVLQSNEIKYKGKMRGYGRKPADHNPAGLSGIHARYPFVVIDEGGAVPKTIFTGANTIAGNQNARVVTIGNPDNPATHFFTLFDPASKWNTLKIDAFSSPNFTDEVVPKAVAEVLLHPDTEREWAHEWGEQSALYASKILADFPLTNAQAVYSFELIGVAFGEVSRDGLARCLCLDVAGKGKDEAIAYAIRAPRRGSSDHRFQVTEEFQYDQNDNMELADRAHMWWRANRQAFVVVDANGIGEGVYSRLKQLGVKVYAFYGQQMPNDKKTYINARAESAFQTARAIKQDEIVLPMYDDVLRGELSSVIWKFGDKNRFKLVSKEEMAEQGLSSPNRHDALSMGVWRLGLGKVRRKAPPKDLANPVSVAGGDSYGH